MANWEIKGMQQQLKMILKKRKITYQELAETMNVSEITIKRLFSMGDPSLQKVIKICEILNIEFKTLIMSLESQNNKAQTFTLEQEKYFAEHMHFYYFYLQLKHNNAEEIEAKFQLPQMEIYRRLRILEDLDLVEVFEGNKFKKKIDGPISWIRHGPLQKKLMLARHMEYAKTFTEQVDQEYNTIRSGVASISHQSYKQMQKDYQELFDKHQSMFIRDGQVTEDKDLIPIAWMFGFGKFQEDIATLIKA